MGSKVDRFGVMASVRRNRAGDWPTMMLARVGEQSGLAA